MRSIPSTALCLSAVLSLLVLSACGRSEPAAEPIRAVRTTTVTMGQTGGTLEFAAEVRARTETRLSFRVGGKVVRRAVDVGDAVRAGAVLAQLDPQDLKLGQDSARAGLLAAQANFDQAEADYKRFLELRDQGFISSAELERRETALKAAKAGLEQARAQAGVQGNQATYASLQSSVAGVVTAVEAEPGQVVAAGTPVLRLAHDGPRDVLFSVPEDKVALVRALEGQPSSARVRLWGSPAEIKAAIREVAASADPATRTFQVKADIGTADVKLGQTATVLVDLPVLPGVIKLPLPALAEQNGKTVVWLLDMKTMTVSTQAVKVAGAEGNDAVIADGLKPGQVVVTAGVHMLTAGQKVKLYQPLAAAGSKG